MIQLLVYTAFIDVEFLGIHPLYNATQESPARHPSVWRTCFAEVASALQDHGMPKRSQVLVR